MPAKTYNKLENVSMQAHACINLQIQANTNNTNNNTNTNSNSNSNSNNRHSHSHNHNHNLPACLPANIGGQRENVNRRGA